MHKQIVDEAAEWFVELNTDDVDLDTRRRFDGWLRTSPEHARAFLEMLPLWEDAAHLPIKADATVEQLIAWAASDDNVIALRNDSSAYHGAKATAPRKWKLGLLAASVAACALTISIVWAYYLTRYPTYTTVLGEQRSLQLSDGSTIQLNARSKVRIRYSKQQRDVELLVGQALFHVAKDPARPFVVHSGDTEVRAVGTQFDVYKKATGVLVTVIEGRVAVTSSGDFATDTQSIAARDSARLQSQNNAEVRNYLSAGEQATVMASEVQKQEHADVSEAIAWTRRELVFHYTSLIDVAEEFNRYNERQLEIDTAQLADIKISGVFSSSDPASLVRFLREQPGVKVVESERAIHIVYE